jgi:hypothetical protein
LAPPPPCLRKTLEQPSFEGSTIGIELVHRPEDNHEYFLDHLLRFAIIVQDFACGSEDQITIPFVQDCEGIIAAYAQGRHEIFVTEHLKARGGEEQGCQFVVR